MLKNFELGRELQETEAVKIEGGKIKIKFKLEVEYESGKSDTTQVAVCDSIR